MTNIPSKALKYEEEKGILQHVVFPSGRPSK